MNLVELANSIVNVEVMYSTYVGDPRKVVPLENMNQSVELVRSNKSSEQSDEEIRKDLTSLAAIAVAVNKQSKKTHCHVNMEENILRDPRVLEFPNSGQRPK